MGRFFETGVYL